jgi:pimeloyl-ACP methyl ester carboxylesterase
MFQKLSKVIVIGFAAASVFASVDAHAQLQHTANVHPHAQLQPTTNVVVTSELNAGGQTNVAAARVRRPVSDALGRAHIGIFVMHPYSSYQNNALCDGLAQRGFTVLCADSVFTGRPDDYYGYEQHAPGVRAGIDYLRGIAASTMLPAVTRVLLLGHSMGAPMMAFYENVAENGAAIACQGPEKILPCVDTDLHGLPRADGVILFDPHLGDSLATFTYVDPALGMSTTECVDRKKQFDMFDAANGYVSDPGGLDDNSATYGKQFRKAFLVHQANRNEALMKEALRLLAERRRVTGNPNDMGDEIPFIVPGADGARLWQPDTALMRSTQRPHLLLARDGTRPTTIIHSVRPASGDLAAASCDESTLAVNVHVWLGAKALRATPGLYDQTENDITGVDYASSATSTVSGVRGIGTHPVDGRSTTPLLIIANTGHYFLRPAEIVYDNAISTDKTVAYSEGAVHGGGPCAQCTRILLNDPSLPTAAANAYWADAAGNGPLERSLDFMAEWPSARF